MFHILLKYNYPLEGCQIILYLCPMKSTLERIFKLSHFGTNPSREILAGFTTFMTMAYILAVNPSILSTTGMDKGALFVTTALSAVIATLIMALYANLPFALAPGMGLNAFFAFSVVLGMGQTWQFALTAVFIEGIIFILLTLFNIREKIVYCIPLNVKKSISVGIGLFIAFIGLKNAGLVVANPSTFVSLGSIDNPTALVALVGIAFTGILLVLRVKGAMLIGLLATTILGFPLGVTHLPSNFDFSVPSIKPIFAQFKWDWITSSRGIMQMIGVTLTFLFVDLFDNIGTLVGVSTKAKMMTKEGKVPHLKQALFADAIGTTIGSVLGTSTVTTFVESAAGVAEGGRTGLTSFTTAMLFLLSIFLAPIFLMVPSAATAPALFIVGVMMASPIKEIDLDDFTEAIPAFFTLIMMPLTYSIANGIYFGVISFVVLKICTGKFKDLNILVVILAILFVINLVV